jgi:Holliday junction DNA helicase RuvB
MNENLNPTNDHFNPEELDLEKRLRPLSFDDFAGQDQILENLKVFVQAANPLKIEPKADRAGKIE